MLKTLSVFFKMGIVRFVVISAIAGFYVQGDALGSSLNGKYLFADFVRDWINIATLTDGNLNWISDISEFAPIDFGNSKALIA